MALLYLVRHGEPSANWAEALDPGLSALGVSQAERAAKRLAEAAPLLVVSSPLRRASETAKPLSERLAVEARIEKAVAEIPSPSGMTLAQRPLWLKEILSGSWSQAGEGLGAWRAGVVSFLAACSADTAVFTHFVAINVAVGAAIGDERVTCFRPAHASVTILEAKGGVLSLVEPGEAAETTIG